MDRFAAKIDSFDLEIETLNDTFGKAVATYEFPYRDGAATEDLGATARTLRLRCYWWEESYADHFGFLDHLKQRELFELTHPKYGVLQGRIRQVSVRHDDRQQLAEVDITFVQDLSSQEGSTYYNDVQAAGEESFMAGQKELQDEVVADAVQLLGPVARDLAAKELDPDLGVVEQFPGVSLASRNWLRGVETAISSWDQAASETSNPANTLLSATSFGSNLPGRIVGSVARAAERYSLAIASQRSAPARFIASLRSSMETLAALDPTHSKTASIAGAQRLGLETAAIYAEDEASRSRLRQAEQARTFDLLGRNQAQVAVGSVMTARDLETSLSVVRTVLQLAVDESRGMVSLKDVGRQLLEHVVQVKLERDRIVTILLDNQLPLHLVCLLQGLPYAYADRLLAINEIPRPNFVSGEVSVYVR